MVIRTTKINKKNVTGITKNSRLLFFKDKILVFPANIEPYEN